MQLIFLDSPEMARDIGLATLGFACLPAGAGRI
jgi:hypothetical protein